MIDKINCNPTIQELYNSRFSGNENKQFKVSLKFAESPITFGVVLTGGDKRPDCKVSSFVENIWFRTPKGENYQQYKTIGTLKAALQKRALHYGYTLEKIIIEQGEPDVI